MSNRVVGFLKKNVLSTCGEEEMWPKPLPPEAEALPILPNNGQMTPLFTLMLHISSSPLLSLFYFILSRYLGDRLQILHSLRKLWQVEAEPSKVTTTSQCFTFKALEIRNIDITERRKWACRINSKEVWKDSSVSELCLFILCSQNMTNGWKELLKGMIV